VIENSEEEIFAHKAIGCSGTWYTKNGKAEGFKFQQQVNEGMLYHVRSRER
jgi:hypothetical protein